jgi:hypothetical protein
MRFLVRSVVVAVVAGLVLLWSCTGLEQKPGGATRAVSAPGQTVGAGLPVQASDTAAPTQTATGSRPVQVSEQETTAPKQAGVGLSNQFVFNILTGSTGGLLVLVAIVLLFAAQRRVPARTARKMATLLSKAVEAAPGDRHVRQAIAALAPKLGITELQIHRFREKVGTSAKGGTR